MPSKDCAAGRCAQLRIDEGFQVSRQILSGVAVEQAQWPAPVSGARPDQVKVPAPPASAGTVPWLVAALALAAGMLIQFLLQSAVARRRKPVAVAAQRPAPPAPVAPVIPDVAAPAPVVEPPAPVLGGPAPAAGAVEEPLELVPDAARLPGSIADAAPAEPAGVLPTLFAEPGVAVPEVPAPGFAAEAQAQPPVPHADDAPTPVLLADEIPSPVDLAVAETVQIADTVPVETFMEAAQDGNPIAATALPETRVVEAVETQAAEAVEMQGVEAIDTQAVEAIETQGVEAVDTQAVEAVETQGIESVDTQAVEAVETQGIESVDPQAVEAIDTQAVELPVEPPGDALATGAREAAQDAAVEVALDPVEVPMPVIEPAVVAMPAIEPEVAQVDVPSEGAVSAVEAEAVLPEPAPVPQPAETTAQAPPQPEPARAAASPRDEQTVALLRRLSVQRSRTSDERHAAIFKLIAQGQFVRAERVLLELESPPDDAVVPSWSVTTAEHIALRRERELQQKLDGLRQRVTSEPGKRRLAVADAHIRRSRLDEAAEALEELEDELAAA